MWVAPDTSSGHWGPTVKAAALFAFEGLSVTPGPGTSPNSASHPLSRGLAFVFQTLSATSTFRILARRDAPFGFCFHVSCLPLAEMVVGSSYVGTDLQLSGSPASSEMTCVASLAVSGFLGPLCGLHTTRGHRKMTLP